LKHPAAFPVALDCALDRFDLALDPLQPVHELDLLTLDMSHF
jgi:hypothetical protein